MKKLSLKAKIAGGITALAIVGAAIVLVVVLVTGGNSNTDDTNPPSGETAINSMKVAVSNLPDPDALDYILTQLDGYWTSGPQFARFTSKDFGYGLLQSGFGVSGKITDVKAVDENSFTIEILVSARPATMMDDGHPERTETIHIDISHFDQDNKTNIKIENLGDGGWRTYGYSGKSLEDMNL